MPSTAWPSRLAAKSFWLVILGLSFRVLLGLRRSSEPSNGPMFEATYGSVNSQSYQGNSDAYVMMLDASGALGWTWQGLSADNDVAYAVAVDPLGNNVVVVGATGATSNLFVRRLSATTGSQIGQYDIGSAANDAATGVTYSTTSYVYVVGWTDGTISASIGLRDVVVIRLLGRGTAHVRH